MYFKKMNYIYNMFNNYTYLINDNIYNMFVYMVLKQIIEDILKYLNET